MNIHYTSRLCVCVCVSVKSQYARLLVCVVCVHLLVRDLVRALDSYQ